MNSPIIEQHSDWAAIEAESHSRPPLDIDLSNAQVWCWSLQERDEKPNVWPDIFDPSKRHQIIKLDDGILRFERHTEFVSITYVGKSVPSSRILDIIGSCPARQLSGIKIILSSKPKSDVTYIFGEQRLFGGNIFFDGVVVTTSFRTDDDGLVPYFVTGEFDDGFGRGRLVKRLIDLEIYRIISLLTLPLVRNASKSLQELERRAEKAILGLSVADRIALGNSIESLAGILADVGAIQSRTRYRIAASNAYYDIVNARLDSLKEVPLGQRQTLRGFIEHRLAPAIATIQAFDRRTEQISGTVRSAMELARTQLEQILQAQNQKLLTSMERRARQQIHLAQAVEGLSVAAISYYGIGLVSYVLKGLPDFGVEDASIVALAVPVVILISVIFTRRARRHIPKIAMENSILKE